jgi:pimeloyl-ACP methyl ester carboxylesterase
MTIRMIQTPSLNVGYEESGPADGPVVILLHGWPYDPRSFDDAVPPLAAAGYRVIVPYVRCCGPTTYRDASVFRTGQQAAVGKDVIELMDALHIDRAVLAGFDWGNRAACVAACLWPERVAALVNVIGYTLLDVTRLAAEPGPPSALRQAWYRFFLSMPQGPAYLAQHREAFTRECWEAWSPNWRFSDALFGQTARSFQTDDWLATTVQFYRHWYDVVPGDPALEPLEARLRTMPSIAAPTIVLQPDADPLFPASFSDGQDRLHTGPYQRRRLHGIGHYAPKEAPRAFVEAIQDAAKQAGSGAA